MKVAFLIRSLNYGGAERQLAALAGGLHKAGHSVLVVVFYPGGPLENDLRESGVKVVALRKKGRWDVFGFFRRLTFFMRQEKPDILHGYLSVPNILTVLLKPLFPNVKMVWGVRASHLDLSRYDLLSRIDFRLECLFSRFADLIIVNSNAGRDYHLRCGFPGDKMVVIPNGIDTGRFKPDPDARARMRAGWGIKADEKLVGLVARLDPMKDHPTFLKAAALLVKEINDVRFICVGDGPESYESEMKRLSFELGLDGKIIWAGPCSDMPAAYNAFDVASLSSYGEGFPNVIGEAMACEVPCAVTDAGDSAYIVGELGSPVQVQAPDKLSSGMAKALALGPEKKGLLRKRIIEQFSLPTLVERTEKELSKLLAHETR